MSELSRAEYIRRVADAIYDTRSIQRIASDLSLPMGDIDWSGASRLVWSEVLTQTQRASKQAKLFDELGKVVVALRGVAIASPRAKGPPPLPGDSWSPDWDIGREDIEKAALQMITGDQRTPFVVYGPEGYGKSWFLERLLTRLRDRDDVRTFMVPEAAFRTDHGADEFFLGLVRCLAEQVDLPPRQVTVRWREEPDLSPAERFHYFVKSLPGSPPARTCLVFDVSDAIWALDRGARNDLFGKIREWKHARTGPLTAVRSVVAFSLTPALMNDDPNQSNLSPSPVVLDGLRASEVRALAALYGLDWTSEELDEVQRTLDGHPRHVRKLIHECTRGHGVTELLARCHLPGRLFHKDLLDLRTKLRSRDSLWRAFQDVARDHTAPRAEDDYRALLSAGLIRSDDGRRFDLRYQLLERILLLPA